MLYYAVPAIAILHSYFSFSPLANFIWRLFDDRAAIVCVLMKKEFLFSVQEPRPSEP